MDKQPSLFHSTKIIELTNILDSEMRVQKIEIVNSNLTIGTFTCHDGFQWQVHLYDDESFEIKGFHEERNEWIPYTKKQVDNLLK